MGKIKALKKIIDELPRKYLKGEVEKIRIVKEFHGFTSRDYGLSGVYIYADDRLLFKTFKVSYRIENLIWKLKMELDRACKKISKFFDVSEDEVHYSGKYYIVKKYGNGTLRIWISYVDGKSEEDTYFQPRIDMVEILAVEV